MSSNPTDLEELEAIAINCDGASINSDPCLSNRDGWARDARTIRSAILEIRELRRALGEPVPELKGTTALVLFFPDSKSAVEFSKLVTTAIPSLKARTLR